jgi:hypothetical protein
VVYLSVMKCKCMVALLASVKGIVAFYAKRKIGTYQLPFVEVESMLDKLTRQFELKKGTDSEIRILKCHLLFAEQQYGY